MKTLEDKLENPVWYSLNETHNKFVIPHDGVQFYQPDVCNFGAVLDSTKTEKSLNAYSKLVESFFIVSENKTPIIDTETVVLERKIDGCQMVLENFVDIKITEDIVQLTENYIDDVYNLIWLVMPGFYRKRGFEMGKYFGIFKDNKLVAITGQRMQTDDFIEISGVVTHPDYTGNGFAKQLITHTTKDILKENKLPILHTNKGNLAIPLYKRLGFKLTRDMNWLLYRRK